MKYPAELYRSSARPNLGLPELHYPLHDRTPIPGPEGKDVDALLEDASVNEVEKPAYGVYRTVDGRRVIVTTPLTDAELQAFRAHPDTFFGVKKRWVALNHRSKCMTGFLKVSKIRQRKNSWS